MPKRIVLKPEDFEDEHNEIKSEVNNFIKHEKLIYSSDIKSAAGEHAQLFNDFKRRLIVLGVDYRENKSKFNERDNFIKLLKDSIDPDKYELLNQHYSQSPFIFASGPFASIFDKLRDESEGYVIKQPEPDHITKELFLKDGEIYIEVSALSYPVFNMTSGGGNNPDFYIPGANFLFKLTREGFVFQTMETNSAFVRDVYLNPDTISLGRLKEEPDIANIQKTCNKYLNRLKNIKNFEMLKNPDDLKLNKSFQILLEKEKAISSLIDVLQNDQIKDDKLKHFAETFNNVKGLIKQQRGTIGIKFNIYKSEGEMFVEMIEARLAQLDKKIHIRSFGANKQ
jgi:hypothetical protein